MIGELNNQQVKEGKIFHYTKGVGHKSHANGGDFFTLLFEPKTTLYTGSVKSEMTVKELDLVKSQIHIIL